MTSEVRSTDDCRLGVLVPHARSLQFEAIKGYLKAGGSAAFLLGEGGEERLGTNVNYLLEEYGMTVHKDSVVSHCALIQ